MTVLNSGISWCTGTINLTVGCTKVSAACDHCYAETQVNRGLHGNRDFGTLKFFPDRVRDLRKFAPRVGADGQVEPKMVFVNSMSDFWHDQIPDDFIHKALDAFEQHPNTIMQILTKRPVRMRKVIEARYGNKGVPANFWLGVSCEDNRVAGRLNILRRLKDRVGDFTAFTSVEPIVAPCDELDFTGVDWVLTGGESGPRARPMEFEWLEQANENALGAGIALHVKQYGVPANNPIVRRLIADASGRGTRMSPTMALKIAIQNGLELAPHEKGGATYKGRVIQEKPPHFHKLKAALNAGQLVA